MCGIAGFWGVGDEQFVQNATACLKHRGPDDSGTYVAPGIGLAQTRLAIIDLSPLGHQPMWNDAHTLAVVFNGEIYNFAELRAELFKIGHTFKGQSDTEVFLHAFEEYGTDCFSKLEGMFAAAFYDARDNSVTLVRDRLGKKPLYYADHSEGVVFASEIKALIQHPSVRKEIDMDSVQQFLAFEYVPAPRTLLRGIQKLMPGTFLKISGTNRKMKSFWEPSVRTVSIGETDALIKLETLLSESVRARMIADVPVGVFLSGGLDSSAVAYYARKHAPGDLHTFSVRFADSPGFDESPYAKVVADHIGTTHHIFDITQHDALAAIEKLPQLIDDPFADASIIPTMLLAQYARTHVTVCLGGDGADELFLGYPTFSIDTLARMFSYIPRPLIRAAHLGTGLIPVSKGYFPLAFKAERFFAGISGDPRYQHQRFLGGIVPEMQAKLLSSHIPRIANVYAPVDDIQNITKDADRMTALSYEYMQTYMVDMVLAKVDRASMAHSLEVRSPFLDYRLVEWALSLPVEHKLKRGVGKYILRALMKNKLPSEVVTRPKHGFALPLGNWLKKELRPMLLDTLSPERLNTHGFFNVSAVEALINEHLTERRDRRKELWTLMTFQLWYDTHA
jgi:asparagine synthase (glutamine-hydrolysing)